VGVDVTVGVAVAVDVSVGVEVLVCVGVTVGVGVWVASILARPPPFNEVITIMTPIMKAELPRRQGSMA